MVLMVEGTDNNGKCTAFIVNYAQFIKLTSLLTSRSRRKFRTSRSYRPFTTSRIDHPADHSSIAEIADSSFPAESHGSFNLNNQSYWTSLFFFFPFWFLLSNSRKIFFFFLVWRLLRSENAIQTDLQLAVFPPFTVRSFQLSTENTRTVR